MGSDEKSLVENGKGNLVEIEETDAFPLEEGTYVRIEEYIGSIPHPDIIKKLGDINPSFPERIMKMTEANNSHDIWMGRYDFILGLTAQINTLIICLAGFGIGAFFLINGNITGAIVSPVISSVAAIAMTALKNFRKQQPSTKNDT